MYEQSFKRIMECSFFGYAFHRIVVDGSGKPVDYEFLEVNAGFERMTGLSAENILGRRVTEVLPGIKDDPFDWIGFYGRITLERTEEEFDQYSQPLGRWYKVSAYSPEAGHFVTVIQDITSEKEQALQMERFFSVNLDLLCIADTSGNFVKVNAEWETVLGYTARELEQRTFLEFVHPDDLQATLAVMAELDEQKPVLQFVNRYRCKDGSYRHIEWRSHPHGALIYAAARDVTERMQAEEALARSAQEQSILLDNIQTQVWYLTSEHSYGAVNKAHADFCGMQNKDMAFKDMYDIFTKDTVEVCRRSNVEVFSTGRPVRTEEWAPDATGEQRLLSILKSPKIADNGTVEYVVCSAEDITERKRIEDKLAVSEDRFSRAIAGTGAGLWDWDMVENTVYFSPLWKSMLGYEEHEVENDFSGWRNLWHLEDADRIETAINDHLEGKTKTYEIEHRLRHKDGSWRWILTRGDIHRDSAGKMVRWVGTNIDITDRKQAEEKLHKYAQQVELNNIELDAALARAEEASRAKGEFLANMSHEIRTPMNAVIGLSDLLMQTELDAKQRNYLTKINSSSRMLLGVINDILDFSKIEAGRLELDPHAFRLDELLDQLKTLFAATADEKGLELLFRVAPNVPRALMGDSLRLGQILAKLLSNALKFTESGQVEVGIMRMMNDECGMRNDETNAGMLECWNAEIDKTADGGADVGATRGRPLADLPDPTEPATSHKPQTATLRFTIRDTGIGMDEVQAGRLFQAFSQADSSTTRRYGGTGLGLVISQRLVESMGGVIAVESGPGQRLLFRAEPAGCRGGHEPA